MFENVESKHIRHSQVNESSMRRLHDDIFSDFADEQSGYQERKHNL